jgi:DNA-directed RNA polymerase specialized sigma24 family protein
MAPATAIMRDDEKDDLRHDKALAPRLDDPGAAHRPQAAPYIAVATVAHEVAPLSPSNRASAGVSREALRAFAAQPEVQERIRTIVAARVGARGSKAVVDDIVQEANLAILESPSTPRSLITAPGWVATVTARTVATHFRRSAAGLRWLDSEADVDAQPAEIAEAGEEGWLIAEWLAPILRHHPRDQETYELLVYKAATEKSHDEVAADHAMTTTALKSRIHEFKTKYQPRWRRRQAMLLAILFGAVALVALAAWLVVRALRPEPAPHPEMNAPVAPPPLDSAFDAPFEPAQPTRPPTPDQKPSPDRKP